MYVYDLRFLYSILCYTNFKNKINRGKRKVNVFQKILKKNNALNERVKK